MSLTSSPTSSLSKGASPSISPTSSKSSSSGGATRTDYGTAPVTKLDSPSPLASRTISQSQTISSTIIGDYGDSSSGISSSLAKSTFSDLLMNGGIAGGIGVIVTVAFLYAIVICRKQKRALILTSTKAPTSIPQKTALSSSSSFSVMNPLKEHQQRPRLPLNKPIKSLKKGVVAASGKKIRHEV